MTSSTTRNASGKQVAPTAGTAIATLTTPAAASYAVRVFVGLGGTGLLAADANNFTVTAGAVSATLGVPDTDGMYGPFEFVMALDGSTSVVVSATANATAGVEYTATILAEPLGVGKLVSL